MNEGFHKMPNAKKSDTKYCTKSVMVCTQVRRKKVASPEKVVPPPTLFFVGGTQYIHTGCYLYNTYIYTCTYLVMRCFFRQMRTVSL